MTSFIASCNLDTRRHLKTFQKVGAASSQHAAWMLSFGETVSLARLSLALQYRSSRGIYINLMIVSHCGVSPQSGLEWTRHSRGVDLSSPSDAISGIEERL